MHSRYILYTWFHGLSPSFLHFYSTQTTKIRKTIVIRWHHPKVHARSAKDLSLPHLFFSHVIISLSYRFRKSWTVAINTLWNKWNEPILCTHMQMDQVCLKKVMILSENGYFQHTVSWFHTPFFAQYNVHVFATVDSIHNWNQHKNDSFHSNWIANNPMCSIWQCLLFWQWQWRIHSLQLTKTYLTNSIWMGNISRENQISLAERACTFVWRTRSARMHVLKLNNECCGLNIIINNKFPWFFCEIWFT